MTTAAPALRPADRIVDAVGSVNVFRFRDLTVLRFMLVVLLAGGR